MNNMNNMNNRNNTNNMNNMNNMNNTNNVSKNILFYSRNCKTCITLFNVLNMEQLLGFFQLFCIDDFKEPDGITVVPTMIVSTSNAPFVGPDTFKWVQQMKFMKQKQIQNTNLQSIKQNMINQSQKKLPGFRQAEMNQISDQYTTKEGDESFEQKFIGPGEEKAIYTAPEFKEKINKGEQKQIIEKLLNIRDNQDDQFANKMEKEQMKAVLKNRQEQQQNQNQFNHYDNKINNGMNMQNYNNNRFN